MVDIISMRTPGYNDGTLASVSAPATAPGPFVMNGDVLVLSLTTSDATGSVNFNGRLLRLDGEIVPWSETLTFSGTGTQTEKVTPLAAGWIIGFDVSRASGTLSNGEVTASVHLARNTGSLLQKMACLASGEITDIRSLGLWGYTYGLAASSTAAPDIQTDTIADPSAGAELTVTVPAAEVWELQSFRAVLTTNATVANREVSLRINNGTTTFFCSSSTTNQTAGTARGYTYSDFGSPWTGSLAATFMFPLPRIMVGAGYEIFTLTSNIQAGDQWSAAVVNYRLHT